MVAAAGSHPFTKRKNSGNTPALGCDGSLGKVRTLTIAAMLFVMLALLGFIYVTFDI